VLYRISQHRASAFLQLGRYGDALLSAQRALDHDPDGIHALVNLANAQGLSGDIDAAIATADRAISRGVHSCKYRRLHAPATKSSSSRGQNGDNRS
jgi:tetratricopeptide (TPR) repeat protein